MAESTECLGVETIVAFIEGCTPDPVRNEVDRHLDACADCRAVVLGAGARATVIDREAIAFGSRVVALPIFPPGTVVAGRYRIGHLVGRGGMGEVYVADDMQLGTRVALKTVKALVADQPHLAVRLKREVLLARQVTHSSVCRVFDFGVHEGVAFLTMELLEGETLGARLRRAGPMTTEAALPIVEQLAGALEAAHAAGVIHRDFKSDNVILLGDGVGKTRAVVTDFGLARAQAGHFDGPNKTHESSSGRLIGTLSYMAPEQIDGGTVTAVTDIYALGVVMFEMVTGQLPFPDSSPMRSAMRRLMERPSSPLSLAPNLPPAWGGVIMRCLARQPGDRFVHARAVAEALARRPATPSAWPRASRIFVASIISAVVLAVAVPLRPSARKETRPIAAPRIAVPLAARAPQSRSDIALTPASGSPPDDGAKPRTGRIHRRGRRTWDGASERPAQSAGVEASAARPPRDGLDDLLDPRDDDLMDPYEGREGR